MVRPAPDPTLFSSPFSLSGGSDIFTLFPPSPSSPQKSEKGAADNDQEGASDLDLRAGKVRFDIRTKRHSIWSLLQQVQL
jgi:hypothetical protein